VRLIEVTSVVDDVQDGRPLPKQIRGTTRALDLPDGSMREPGGSQEMPLGGSHGLRQRLALKGNGHVRVAPDDALAHESRHEDLCVLEVWILPRGAVQPERSTRRVRQRRVSSIAELAWR